MKTFYLTVIGLLFASIANSQNQYHVSEYMLHQPFVNPASIGSYNGMNGALFYKNQWTGIDGAPRFGGLDFNAPIGGNSFAGIGLVYDKIGVTQNTDVSGKYAYRLKLSDGMHLAFGLAASMRIIQSDYSSLPEVSTDPSFNNNTPTILQPNFKFGTYLYTEKFYVGIAVPNLLKNDIQNTGGGFTGNTEFDINDMHQYLHVGAAFELSNKLDLNPSFMLKNVAGAPMQFDINAHLVFSKKVGFGVSYRTSQELIGLLNFQINDTWKLGYAYDFGMADIGTYSSGSHELMLVFNVQAEKQQAMIQAPRY